MEKASSFSTLALLVLGLTACNANNDITGINAGKTAVASPPTLRRAASESGPEALAKGTAFADRQHKVAVQAPNQPAPIQHERGETSTATSRLETVCVLPIQPRA